MNERETQLAAIVTDALACWQGEDERQDDAQKRSRSARSRATLRARLKAITDAPTPNPLPRTEREPCVIGKYCRKHGFVHGAEAEELRERFEKIAARWAEDDRRALVDGAAILRSVLDEVDARDSLAYVSTPPASLSAQEPETKPVAYIQHHKHGDNLVWEDPGLGWDDRKPGTPLYAAPSVPPTPDAVRTLWEKMQEALNVLSDPGLDNIAANRKAWHVIRAALAATEDAR